jgi:hypothetical protein
MATSAKPSTHALPEKLVAVRVVLGLACTAFLYVFENRPIPRGLLFVKSLVTFEFLIAALNGYVAATFFWLKRRRDYSKVFAGDIAGILASKQRGAAEKLLAEVLLFVLSFFLLAVTTPLSEGLSVELIIRLLIFVLGYWLLLNKLDVHPLTSVFSKPRVCPGFG